MAAQICQQMQRWRAVVAKHRSLRWWVITIYGVTHTPLSEVDQTVQNRSVEMSSSPTTIYSNLDRLVPRLKSW